MSPTVSIIIPNYNYARYLEQRFETIRKQSFTDYEIIFLDDASNDESQQLFLDKFRLHVTAFHLSEANSGSPFAQWNRGTQMARGKYVWIAEADDLSEPTFLEKLVCVLDQYPHVGLAYCQSSPVDAAGKTFGDNTYLEYTRDLDPDRWTRDFVNNGISEVEKYLVLKNSIPNVSGVLFRRSSYISAGWAETKLRLCGDWLTYCRVLRISDIAFTSEVLNYHRQHPKKVTDNSIVNLVYFREFLQVQQHIFDKFRIDKDTRRMAAKRFFGEWRRLAMSDYGRITVGGHLRTALMTLRQYPESFGTITGLFARNLTVSAIGRWR